MNSNPRPYTVSRLKVPTAHVQPRVMTSSQLKRLRNPLRHFQQYCDFPVPRPVQNLEQKESSVGVMLIGGSKAFKEFPISPQSVVSPSLPSSRRKPEHPDTFNFLKNTKLTPQHPPTMRAHQASKVIKNEILMFDEEELAQVSRIQSKAGSRIQHFQSLADRSQTSQLAKEPNNDDLSRLEEEEAKHGPLITGGSRRLKKKRYTTVSPKQFPFEENKLLSVKHFGFQISQNNQSIMKGRSSPMGSQQDNIKLFNYNNMLSTKPPPIGSLQEVDGCTLVNFNVKDLPYSRSKEGRRSNQSRNAPSVNNHSRRFSMGKKMPEKHQSPRAIKEVGIQIRNNPTEPNEDRPTNSSIEGGKPNSSVPFSKTPEALREAETTRNHSNQRSASEINTMNSNQEKAPLAQKEMKFDIAQFALHQDFLVHPQSVSSKTRQISPTYQMRAHTSYWSRPRAHKREGFGDLPSLEAHLSSEVQRVYFDPLYKNKAGAVDNFLKQKCRRTEELEREFISVIKQNRLDQIVPTDLLSPQAQQFSFALSDPAGKKKNFLKKKSIVHKLVVKKTPRQEAQTTTARQEDTLQSPDKLNSASYENRNPGVHANIFEHHLQACSSDQRRASTLYQQKASPNIEVSHDEPDDEIQDEKIKEMLKNQSDFMDYIKTIDSNKPHNKEYVPIHTHETDPGEGVQSKAPYSGFRGFVNPRLRKKGKKPVQQKSSEATLTGSKGAGSKPKKMEQVKIVVRDPHIIKNKTLSDQLVMTEARETSNVNSLVLNIKSFTKKAQPADPVSSVSAEKSNYFDRNIKSITDGFKSNQYPGRAESRGRRVKDVQSQSENRDLMGEQKVAHETVPGELLDELEEGGMQKNQSTQPRKKESPFVNSLRLTERRPSHLFDIQTAKYKSPLDSSREGRKGHHQKLIKIQKLDQVPSAIRYKIGSKRHDGVKVAQVGDKVVPVHANSLISSHGLAKNKADKYVRSLQNSYRKNEIMNQSRNIGGVRPKVTANSNTVHTQKGQRSNVLNLMNKSGLSGSEIRPAGSHRSLKSNQVSEIFQRKLQEVEETSLSKQAPKENSEFASANPDLPGEDAQEDQPETCPEVPRLKAKKKGPPRVVSPEWMSPSSRKKRLALKMNVHNFHNVRLPEMAPELSPHEAKNQFTAKPLKGINHLYPRHPRLYQQQQQQQSQVPAGSRPSPFKVERIEDEKEPTDQTEYQREQSPSLNQNPLWKALALQPFEINLRKQPAPYDRIVLQTSNGYVQSVITTTPQSGPFSPSMSPPHISQKRLPDSPFVGMIQLPPSSRRHSFQQDKKGSGERESPHKQLPFTVFMNVSIPKGATLNQGSQSLSGGPSHKSMPKSEKKKGATEKVIRENTSNSLDEEPPAKKQKGFKDAESLETKQINSKARIPSSYASSSPGPNTSKRKHQMIKLTINKTKSQGEPEEEGKVTTYQIPEGEGSLRKPKRKVSVVETKSPQLDEEQQQRQAQLRSSQDAESEGKRKSLLAYNHNILEVVQRSTETFQNSTASRNWRSPRNLSSKFQNAQEQKLKAIPGRKKQSLNKDLNDFKVAKEEEIIQPQPPRVNFKTKQPAKDFVHLKEEKEETEIISKEQEVNTSEYEPLIANIVKAEVQHFSTKSDEDLQQTKFTELQVKRPKIPPLPRMSQKPTEKEERSNKATREAFFNLKKQNLRKKVLQDISRSKENETQEVPLYQPLRKSPIDDKFAMEAFFSPKIKDLIFQQQYKRRAMTPQRPPPVLGYVEFLKNLNLALLQPSDRSNRAEDSSRMEATHQTVTPENFVSHLDQPQAFANNFNQYSLLAKQSGERAMESCDPGNFEAKNLLAQYSNRDNA